MPLNGRGGRIGADGFHPHESAARACR